MRRIEHVLGDGKSTRPSSHAPEELDSLLDGNPEVLGPLKQLRLVDVVGSHPHTHQGFTQRLHDLQRIVDPTQQDALIPHRYPRTKQSVTGL